MKAQVGLSMAGSKGREVGNIIMLDDILEKAKYEKMKRTAEDRTR